jgi:hypothetical protein
MQTPNHHLWRHSLHRQARTWLLLTVFLGSVTGSAEARAKHWYTPWRRATIAAPVPVSELSVATLDNASAPSLPQFWNRNTLRVDLGGLAGSGGLALAPNAVNGWPLRIEFAVRPGSMKQLEVVGDTRVLFAVTAEGAETLLLPLGSGVYTPSTKLLTLRWE